MSKLQTNDLNSIQEFTKNQLMADFDVLFDTANLPNPLNEASRYAISNGGKRVRPLLVLATFLAAGGCVDTPVFGAVRRAMLAIEMIHSYSLVHDDLPCMDDDDLRRGKPTCHVVYGEATAMLVGDVLQSLAFDVLGGDYWGDTDDVKFAKLTKILASNARRMVAGQQADLNGEQKQLNQNELEAIHKDKTGALIVASVLMGAVCGGTSDERMASLGEYARLIGLAYQVQDDVLDVVADTQTLGKMAGSDEKLDKSTYVKLLGVDNARAYADELFDKAREQVADLGDDNLLLQMVDWLQKRDH
ncbi:polyprenyl synthetase family protein [Moraxella bovis]|nr:farnesyl diphosphate synthase [Moraxella bovis]UYZ95079.1 polyprenyl synthetase family protein [Moraxella bovis]